MAHLERILFVVGEQNSGKSTTLRSIYRDERFASAVIPPRGRIPPASISGERGLQLILRSPHEAKMSLPDFISNMATIVANPGRFRRINIAGALQPFPANRMRADIVKICAAVMSQLKPERLRLAILDPVADGTKVTYYNDPTIDALRKLDVEIMKIDGRDWAYQDFNGLLLADFFDFT